MKQITGWWFCAADRVLPHGDGRRVEIGVTHTMDGDIIPCERGLHLSKRLIDALQYATGPILYKVRGSGTIVPHGTPINKCACRIRSYLAGGIDISKTLKKFACECALSVVRLWDAPELVIQYLKTGDESIRDAAWDAARAAARAAAQDATKDAAWAAAWDAAWDAAWAAARAAARAAAWAAARDATRAKQNALLTKMVKEAWGDFR